ncbi:DMT family transporter [Neotabrizicola shimadae]|uniref:DMT family transporter n=1 Tax=Neotabrizicola shimadae TaxID=2807096 RepID=A0A8G0ZYR3_9RHOB|nr:DMT family transporter [Neotabrizicola shimadae]QYZ71385.1 DMT family transporter [Neotabrizicola shimadae]
MTRFAALSPTTRGILLLLLAVVLFTAMDAAAKGLVARYPAPLVVWARFVGQLVIVMLLLRGRAVTYARTRYPAMHFFRALTAIGSTFFFFASLNHIGLAEATALGDVNPVLITLGAAVFLGERLGPARLFCVMLAALGALVVVRPGAEVFTWAALLPLASAASYAINALLTRAIGPREPAWTPMLLGALIATALASLALPWYWQPIALADLGLFLVLGALGTAAQLCIIRAFSQAEAMVLAPFGYAGTVFATLWGILFFGEFPDITTILGAGLIVSAGILLWRSEARTVPAAA